MFLKNYSNKRCLTLLLFAFLPFIFFDRAFAQTETEKWIDSLANEKAKTIVKFKLDSIKAATTKIAKKTPKLTFLVSGNSQFNAGNISRLLISSVNRLQYRNSDKTYKMNLDATYVYGEKSLVLAENDLMINFNHSFWYERKFYGILFSTYEFSNLRGINNRYVGGAGFGWQIVNISPEKAKNMAVLPYISLTNAIIYEETEFLKREGFKVWRNSSRFLANFNFFNNRFICNNTIFIQPSLSNQNLRANWTNLLRFPVYRGLSFQITTDYSYESIVLTGRQNADWRVLFGFSFGNM